MLPDEALIKLPALELWGLRARAVTEQVTLPELGRILYHLNQKRGYKSAKGDESGTDAKITDYVKAVNNRYDLIRERNQTIGQYFHEQLTANEFYRCKEQVFPRRAYIEEFDRIMDTQRRFYPDILTAEEIDTLRNRIIYYQRGLKSCKHLVSRCELEKREIEVNGRTVCTGPKVAPRTSPLFQVCKLWESINNLTLRNRYNDTLYITIEQKQQIFRFMDNHAVLKLQDLYRILGISRKDGWYGGKAIGKGLSGNTTKVAIREALADDPRCEELLRFELEMEEAPVDKTTGEVSQLISRRFEREPLYHLWQILYSVAPDELPDILREKCHITNEESIKRLCALDFTKAGYGNKSAKAMRRILPFLQQGCVYSDACEAAGYRHSNYLTNEENANRELKSHLEQLQKGALRQPIIEKVLNQMVNIVNAVIDTYGRPDEIRVELARELKQSRDEREQTFSNINKRERENNSFAERIKEEYNLTPTRTRIEKWRLWQETGHCCAYCGQPVDVRDFMEGAGVEREHIIPKSLLFDNSFSNKVCACRACNKEKNNRTAHDYMKSLGEDRFREYAERVDEWLNKRLISSTKRDKLLMPADEIPQDFIDRQLRQSQYIARKATEILRDVCRNVTTTSGSVTDFIRHTWGWDRVLHTVNFERYKTGGLTEMREFDHSGHTGTEEVIKAWNKRIDHRHHAIDALAVACTRQGYIQQLNRLNTLKDLPNTAFARQGEAFQERLTRLERYILAQPHFTTEEVTRAVESILVSFKAGKKAATLGKRYVHKGGRRICVQERIIVPRGALHEESVYGQRTINGQQCCVIKYPLGVGQGMLFDNVKDNRKKIEKTLDSIVDRRIRELIEERLRETDYDLSRSFKEPLYFETRAVNHPPVRHQIRSVRCLTGLKAVVPVRFDAEGVPVGFVKPGNNHHIALYRDAKGNLQENVVTFWHAVERRKYGLPIIVTNPEELWDRVERMQLPESFLEQLPLPGWQLDTTLQQNEMFILGMDEESYRMAVADGDKAELGRHLYKVQNISSRDYRFCLHTQTQFDKNQPNKPDGRFVRINGFKAWDALNPHKVTIDLLGNFHEQ